MKLVIFGRSISSSWANSHAMVWRGLIKALDKLGHRAIFFERNLPEYARHRDLTDFSGGELILYDDWEQIRPRAESHLTDADAAFVTSFCPDAAAASETLLGSPARLRCFYDMNTAFTLRRLRAGEPVEYVPERGLGDFDVVLSYTGGQALTELKKCLGARHVAPLYGGVDPETFRPMEASDRFRSDLSYLGGYTDDRKPALEALFLEPARRRDDFRFLISGPDYPAEFFQTGNVGHIPYLPPEDHAEFYSSARLALSITRPDIAMKGYCPSDRLFEAAACGAALLSDEWEGLDYFFEPGVEILVARTTGHVMDALAKSPEELSRIARAGREKLLAAHTSARRALELENILEAALSLPVETAGGVES